MEWECLAEFPGNTLLMGSLLVDPSGLDDVEDRHRFTLGSRSFKREHYRTFFRDAAVDGHPGSCDPVVESRKSALSQKSRCGRGTS